MHTYLLLIALVSCFAVTVNAQEEEEFFPCSFCLYTTNTGAPYDDTRGACYTYDVLGGSFPVEMSTPLVGIDNGFRVDYFRYVGLTDCELCTFTAYPSANQNGMGVPIPSIARYADLEFCARSFRLDCGIPI